MRKKSQGFTLLELMVVIAIIAIVTTVAIPTFRAFTQNNRSEVTNDLMVSTLNLARNEAFTRKKTVTICGLNEAQNACVGTKAWTNGWVVFEDEDSDGVLDPTEIILKVYNPFGDNLVPLEALETFISYNRLGFPNISTNFTFAINPPGCTGENNRTITVTKTGVINASVTNCS